MMCIHAHVMAALPFLLACCLACRPAPDLGQLDDMPDASSSFDDLRGVWASWADSTEWGPMFAEIIIEGDGKFEAFLYGRGEEDGQRSWRGTMQMSGVLDMQELKLVPDAEFKQQYSGQEVTFERTPDGILRLTTEFSDQFAEEQPHSVLYRKVD